MKSRRRGYSYESTSLSNKLMHIGSGPNHFVFLAMLLTTITCRRPVTGGAARIQTNHIHSQRIICSGTSNAQAFEATIKNNKTVEPHAASRSEGEAVCFVKAALVMKHGQCHAMPHHLHTSDFQDVRYDCNHCDMYL
jgi:hypothetical protein